jgi:hypothetical protein
MNLNEIVGLVLLVVGLLMVVISLAAFVKIQFFDGKTKGLKEINETLKQVNALLKTWAKILLLIPEPMRHIIVLLPLGLIVAGAGVWILVYKPI